MPRTHRMSPFKQAEIRAREAEYQALWQACERAARKDEYQHSTVPVRQVMLREALTMLLDRRAGDRRRQGKQMCNISVELMIERHLKREAQPRSPFHARNFLENANNELYNAHNAPPAMGVGLAPLARMEVPPIIKYDRDATPPQYDHSLAEDFDSPKGYPPPILENRSHNTTLYDELAACREDRCALVRRLVALESKLAHMTNLVSLLCDEIHPKVMVTPQTPDTMAMFEHNEMMDEADL
ncbi:hypothetical protein G7Z17_g13046 [Cylindrodendrum hubeiense]|uniref:Uncharacterized protein n=1 Tax=Cylindrodendrum hubeiense TaxID=595255 RepID=A0A9P5GZP6_9HYPO|nr:hypothetical protein G7Z17_g13046 [Cylindrodendrum hubeiense]